jgi:hypothetical protein
MSRILLALLLLTSTAVPDDVVTDATPPARRRAVRFPSTPVPVQQTIVLTPSKDATLFQTTDGSLANGTGVHLFAGMTGGGSRRRALIAFDVATKIPAGSQITRVVLTMNVTQSIAGASPIALHRVTSNWGEGASSAGTIRDGVGATSRAGDATWIHTFQPNQRWSTPGGDFASALDATASASGFSQVTWASSTAMIARVQSWLDQPATNFGWILIGNESTSTTAKRLDSREIDPETTRPTLTIDFVK